MRTGSSRPSSKTSVKQDLSAASQARVLERRAVVEHVRVRFAPSPRLRPLCGIACWAPISQPAAIPHLSSDRDTRLTRASRIRSRRSSTIVSARACSGARYAGIHREPARHVGACCTLETLASRIQHRGDRPITGRRSAARKRDLRTLDLAGLDICGRRPRSVAAADWRDRAAFVPLPFIAAIVERGRSAQRPDAASTCGPKTSREDPHARPVDAQLPRACARAWPRSRERRARRWPSASAFSRPRSRRRNCCGAHWARCSSTRRRSPMRSPSRSMTSIAPCAGDRLGARAV